MPLRRPRSYNRQRFAVLRTVLGSWQDRLRNHVNDAPSFRIGPWTAIPSQNLIECDSRSIRLEPRAMDVLVALARAGGAVVSIESLMTTVWKDVTVGDGSVYLAIGQLRQALGNGDESTRYIETIPKRGYRLTASVERVDADTPAAPAAPTAPVPHRPPAWLMAVAALVGVAAVGAAAILTFRNRVRPPATHSVAVLPFDNLSSDPEQEFFADGITVETLHALSRVRGLRVTSRTSSFRFKDRSGDLRAVGEALGVEHVLQGSVRTAGDQVRITVQLSRAWTGDRLWSETYERRLDDIFVIQDDIARSVANALQVKLGIGAVGRVPGMTRNVAAYEEYLRARARNLDWQPQSFPLAVAHLQRAVALDPSFAIAWARLSSVYGNGMVLVPERAEEWRKKAAEALEQARALTPDAPDVLEEVGIVEARRRNWVSAARAFEELQMSSAHYGLADRASGPRGVLLLAVGRTRDAVAALERARSQDPFAPAFAGFLSAAYLADRNITSALAEIDRGLTLEGLETRLLEFGFVAALNQDDQALIRMRLAAIPDESLTARVSRRLLRFIDAPAGAAADIRLLASSASAAEKALLAEWAAFYREPELSLQLLTDAAPHVSHPAFLWQPLFRDVRGLPAFRDLARTLGLVEYWRTFGWSDFCQPSTGDEFVCR